MYFLVVSALMLPTVLGTCCFPNQLFGNVYNSGQGILSKTAIDFTVGRYVLRSTQTNDDGFILFDFVAGKQYTKTNGGSCKITKVDSNSGIQRCIPASATKLGTSYMGVSTFFVDTYTYSVGSRNMTIAVSKNKCYPVIAVTDQASSSQTNIFANLVETDSDAMNLLNPSVSDCVDDDSTVG